MTVDPVGPERLTLADILRDLRRWLGYRPAVLLHVPVPLVLIATRLGDILGGPLNTTALRQLAFGNAARVEPFTAATGIRPRRWQTALLARPAQAQDRWHARLYFLRPLLRIAVALTWIGSGIAGLLRPVALEHSIALFGTPLPGSLFWGACAIDIVLGFAVALRWHPAWLAAIQLALVAFYSAVLTAVQPGLWLEPFGPLLKNVPFVVAVLILAAIEPER